LVNFWTSEIRDDEEGIGVELVATYSHLDNDVSYGSNAKGVPRGRPIRITDFLEDDTLVEVDAIVSNITGQRQKPVLIKRPRDLRFTLTRGTKTLRSRIKP
jgi:hypothetical protein